MAPDYVDTGRIASGPFAWAKKLGEGAAVEIMAQRQQAGPQNGEQRLAAIMRLRQRKGHQPQSDRTKAARQEGTMRPQPLPQPNRTEQDGQDQPDFMNQWMQENATRRRDKRQKQRRGDAMRNAQRRQANGQPVKTLPRR